MSGHYGYGGNRSAAEGGPQGVQRSYASSLKETEGLFHSYEHLQGLTRGDSALQLLRKVAAQVKPIMRKRGWRVQILAEFLPYEQNLLGLNINRGYKICIRLRYHNNTDLFLPIEQIVDTMLHELCHIIWGEHDSRFHALWDELRAEYETLLFKGYTGEGFLSEGHRLGGGGGSRNSVPSPHEMRRLARASAEKRNAQGSLGKGSGQRLGGTPLHQGRDVRQVIADQVTQRNAINNGCASGRKDAVKLSDNSNNTFKTKAEEDDANNRAIAQALFELMELEEERKLKGGSGDPSSSGGLAWDPQLGLYDPKMRRPETNNQPSPLGEDEQMKWALEASMRETAKRTTEASPVSPLTPSRTLSAPSIRSRPDSSHSSLRRGEANNRPISRLVNDSESTEGSKRRRMSQASSVSSLSSVAHSGSSTSGATSSMAPIIDLTEPFDPNQWTCEICTCINPVQYLACDACGSERPQKPNNLSRSLSTATTKPRWAVPKPAQTATLGWNCTRCGSFHEHKWWTCSACGQMKESS